MRINKAGLIIASMVLAILATSLPFVGKASAAKTRALLIGVTDYSDNDELPSLIGPINDVRLMWHILNNKMDISDITVLAGTNGQSAIKALNSGEPGIPIAGAPTKQLIASQMQTVINSSSAGDLVVLYFSGHGSYMPALNTGAPAAGMQNRERDGFDELFLPMDTGKYDPQTRKVKNALSDNEIGAILHAAPEGVRIWIIFDTCHSGDLTRGINKKTRHADPTRLLGIPSELLAANYRRTRGINDVFRQRKYTDDYQWVSPQNDRNIIAFSAVPSHAMAVERPIPERGNKTYGVFTDILAKALSTYQPDTFQQLATLINQSLPADVPPPVFEGPLDQQIDLKTMNGKPLWNAEIRKNDTGRRITINAGMIQGLQVGSILSLYEPKKQKKKQPEDEQQADEKQQPLGYFEIEHVGMNWAEGSPLPFNKMPTFSLSYIDQPNKIFSAVVERSFVIGKRIALPNGYSNCAAIDQQADKAHQIIKILCDEKNSTSLPVTWVKANEEADIYLEVSGNEIFIADSVGYLVTEQGNRYRTPSIQIVPDLQESAKNLKDNIWRKLRVFNLLELAKASQASSDRKIKKLSRYLQVKISVERGGLNNGQPAASEDVDCLTNASELNKPTTNAEKFIGDGGSESSPSLYHCDLVFVKINNNHPKKKKRFDLTVLYIDAVGGIQHMQIGDPRLTWGQSLGKPLQLGVFTWCPPTLCTGERGGPKPDLQPLGMEYLAIIAVERDAKARGSTASFGYLAQQGLDWAVKTRGKRGGSAFGGTLGDFERLLRDSTMSPGKTRGIQPLSHDKVIIKLYRWNLREPNLGS